MKKGYLTVYLSLTIAIMLSLILALFQNARIGAIKMKAECAADISMNSVLAEYNRALFEKYDLLLTDCSYQTDSPSMANVEEHLRYFMKGNFESTSVGRITGSATLTGMTCDEVSIPAYSFATDGEGAVLRRQILEYMRADPVMDRISEATANLGVLAANGFDTYDVEACAAENRERIDEMLEDAPEIETDEGETEEPIPDNPADAVESQKGLGVVSLSVPDPSSVSVRTVDLDRYMSHRENNRGTGLDESENLSVTDRLLLNQYFVEKTGCYTEPKDDGLLKYQLEYIIAGKDCDYDNLESCGRTLLFWREASNFAYIMTDGVKVGEAEALALILSAVILMPELMEPFKMSILFAWSFAESISDMRRLYLGGRVPLIKTAASWQLSLENLPFFRDNLAGGGGDGLSYKDYLRMLLMLEDLDKKTARMGDIIEMDVRQSPGDGNFRLDWCLDIFEADMRLSSRYGFDMHLMRTYGYEKR
ncbi:MAG: DUF5702 domain-containing protein [Lachnospiraceae bacterium]|nr:DUF5702 domain-containing protein [Lachnospiraceae bacterium]